MDMGTQGSGRKRLPNRERLSAEDDALNQIAREAEARLAAKRAARAEAREIRMKELERQQKEIYQVQKKYYGLDTKWGDIEQWMEDSERYSRRSRRNTSASDEDERLSVGSRGSLRTNGYDGEPHGSQSLNRRSSRPWHLYNGARPAGSHRVSVFDDSSLGGARRSSTCGSRAVRRVLCLPHTPLPAAWPWECSPGRGQVWEPSECSGHLNSSSRASSRASSARASPVVEERPDKDFTEKGSRNMPGLSAATLASLGGTSSRRGSGDTSISIDTEASMREIKELSELKDQIQDVEGRYMQGLKEMKDSLAEVEEKYKKAMVSNAQLDNEKTNFMYQVDTLKDMLLELEEQLAESRRQYEEKNKEFEREKHAHSILQFQFAEVKEALKQRGEMLEEIRQLQQKQASYIREISDLQETIEWKDKKIGALERQKEFFDSIRSERDDLREEVVMLKEEFKKHGIILNSEIATNGETSDTLNNVDYPGPTKMTKEELNALTSTGEGTLGRAHEVEVKNDIVDNVGKRTILQNSEKEQPKEDTIKDCVDTVASHPGDSAENQKVSEEDKAPSLGQLAGARDEEQVHSQILENMSCLENTGQVQSNEVISVAGDRPGASLSSCLRELDSEGPGSGSEQDSCHALDINSQSKESVEKQEKEKQEDFRTTLEEVSSKPCQESVPSQIPDIKRVSSIDTGGQSRSHTEKVEEGGEAHIGEQVGTVASHPPEYNDDTVCQDEECAVAAPPKLGPSIGHSLETEVTNQKVAEPRGSPVQSTEVDRENHEEPGLREEKPAETHVQTIPGSPAAKSGHQEAAGPSVAGTDSEPLETKEPSEEKRDPQGEALESSQKKAKNKKKKNKKKKPPAPVETLKAVKKELMYQDADLSEVKEEEQVKFTTKTSVVEAQDEVAKNPKQKVVAESGENVDCPEDPDLDGNCNQEVGKTEAEKVRADGDTLNFEDDTIQLSGTSMNDKELEEDVIKSDAKKGGATQSSPPEPEEEAVNGSSPRGSPTREINDVLQTESVEGHIMPEQPSQTVKKALDSVSLESEDLSAPAGESGDLDSESREDTERENEKGKSKEDCTMS
ncbi:leucine-rich repeat flightless-interacting protein 1 isoform X9 [Nycticebus coucang]|uniref:leucine-rich repeat flightless-interacting protein 1 isoform X9 n=1 Tax=Nycticebus coucang TaxID=9470 RepID=UPI00234D9010|nr:leucine-rich repeat flightless-interacting protein 1 isoform X9 [Nycticebus coucang]